MGISIHGAEKSEVATVSADGEVKAVKAGEAAITATAGSLSKTCSVTVKEMTGLEILDLAFRNELLRHYDKNKDGMLTQAELEPVKELEIVCGDNLDIKSFERIE